MEGWGTATRRNWSQIASPVRFSMVVKISQWWTCVTAKEHISSPHYSALSNLATQCSRWQHAPVPLLDLCVRSAGCFMLPALIAWPFHPVASETHLLVQFHQDFVTLSIDPSYVELIFYQSTSSLMVWCICYLSVCCSSCKLFSINHWICPAACIRASLMLIPLPAVVDLTDIIICVWVEWKEMGHPQRQRP